MFRTRLFAAGIMFVGVSGAAQAAPDNDANAFITLGAVSEAPRGFVEMCRTEQTFCASSTKAEQGDTGLITGALRSDGRTLFPRLSFAPRGETPRPIGSEFQTWAPITIASVPKTLGSPSYGWNTARFDLSLDRATEDRGPLWADQVPVVRLVPLTLVSEIASADVPVETPTPVEADQVPAERPVPLTLVSATAPADVPVETPTPVEDARAAQTEIALLHRINKLVNERVAQRTDMQVYGKEEFWHRSGIYAGAAGDCEDIAIEKRFELIAAGFDAKRMYFAVVYMPTAGLHTILVARTVKGDVVLDSRTPYIERWDHTSYSWITIQSMSDPMVWRAPGARPNVLAGNSAAGRRNA